MKQKLRVFLTLLLCAVASVGWGETGTIEFGTNKVKINATVVYAKDNLDNTWDLGTTGTTSFTQNADYSQIGSSSKPAKTITFTTTLPNDVTITSLSAKFGGFSGTAGTVTLSVDNVTVGTGNLNGTEDVIVSSSSEATGKVLKVTVTNIAKGVKCYYVSYTYTSSGGTSKCATPIFNPEAGTYTGTQPVSISTTTEGATIHYTLDGTDPTTNSTTYSAAINVSSTTTIKAIAVKDGMDNSAVASATYTIVEPFVIEDGVFVFDNSEGNNYGSDYQAGSVKVQSGVWTAGNVTMTTAGRNCWLNSTTLRIYAASGNDAAGSLTFAVPENNVIKKIEVEGTSMNLFTATPGTYDAGEGNTTGTWTGAATTVTFTATGTAVFSKITVTYEEGTPVEEKTDIATINGISPTTLTVGDLDEFTLDATYAEGVTDDDYTIAWESDNTGVLEVDDETYEAKAAGTANVTVTITPTDTEAYNTVSKSFAVTVNEPEQEGNWVLTSLSELTTSDVFVIVGNNGSNYAMSNNNGTGSAPSAVAVTVSDNYLTGDISDNIKWNVSGNATEGYTFYPNGSTDTWLYCTNSNNGVRVGDNSNKTFKVVDDYLQHVGTSRYVGIYNSSDWRCYTSINANIEKQTFAFYKFVAGAPTPSITAEDVEIAYNATSGSISYTVNNPVDGGELTATDNADWLELGTVGETVSFTASENQLATARTAEVVLTYTYGEGLSVTKTVTITQTGNPNVVDEISDITETNKDYAIRGTIVAKSARGLVFGDGTGYVYYYLGSAPEYNVGDIKKISGTMGSYNHVFQFTSSATIEGAESSNYQNTPAVTVVDATSMAAYSDGLHLSDYVQFEGTLVKSGNYYNIKVNGLGTDASISYPTDEQKTALDNLENKNVVVKGYFSGVSGGHFSIVLVSIEEATKTVEVTISDAGYSTLYYGTKNLTVPEDMEAYTVKVTTKVERSTTYNAGDVIPAGTGVVLKADKGDYVFTVVDEAPAKDEANMLRGSDEKATTTGGTYFYALTLDKNGQNPGFYWMVENGGAYDAGAHKAYLALDKTFAELAGSGSAKGFLALPGDETDGIHQIENGQLTFDNAEIYNLSGQRVQKAAKGIYIVNGKKVVVK